MQDFHVSKAYLTVIINTYGLAMDPLLDKLLKKGVIDQITLVK